MKIHNFRLLAALCSAAIALNSGCAEVNDSSDPGSSETLNSSSENLNTHESLTPDSISDKEYTPSQKADCTITFTDSELSVEGNGAHASGSTAVITAAGIYRITGQCSDGSVLINADGDDNVVLLLDGISLTSESGAVIRCENSDKLTITLADGSNNTLTDAQSYADTEEDSPDAAVFCRDNMIINGSGSLTVNARYLDGIKSKDGIKIAGGNISVNSVDDGITGKDFIIIGGGRLDITSAGDALKSTNDTDTELGYISITDGSVNIITNGDAIDACTQFIISGGELAARTGGGSATVVHSSEQDFGGRKDFFDFDSSNTNSSSGSTKGIKAEQGIFINDGNITLDCADDALHSGTVLQVSGGVLDIASGDDALHADGSMIISNGDITISSCYEALEALSLDINGGKINATALDDGINIAGGDNSSEMGFGSDNTAYYMSMTAGDVTVNAAGDGIDSNGTVALSGGELTIFGPTNGANGSLDYNNSFAVSGGTLVALGSRQMAMAPSTLSQPCLSIYSKVNENTAIEVLDETNNVIISLVSPKAYESLIFSSDKMTSGNTYTITANGSIIAEVKATDGVSGGGATGGEFGDFGGMGNFGGMDRPHGRNDRPDGDVPAMPDGMTPPSLPENGEMPTKPDRMTPPDIL